MMLLELTTTTTSTALLLLLSTLLFASTAQATPTLYGVNYGLRKGPDWAPFESRCKSYDEVYNELNQLKQSGITDNVRIYSLTDCNDGAVMLRATQELGMGLWLGLWVGPDSSVFEGERAKLLELVQQFDVFNILGIHVSSEAIYRGDITSTEAIRLRNIIKTDLQTAGENAAALANLPVTITDIEESLSADIDLITVDDSTVTINMFPFWERCCIDINGDTTSTRTYASAAEYFAERMEFVESVAGSRQIIVTETGWADAGVNEAANNANPASMAKWMRDFVCLANEKNWQYFWFNAYDDSWRRIQEDDADSVEGHFGIFYESGDIKPYIRDLVIDCSQGYMDIDPNDNSIPPPAENPSTMAPATPAPTMANPTTASPTTLPPPTTASPTGVSPNTLEPTSAIILGTSPPTLALATNSPSDSPSDIPSGTPTFAATTTRPSASPSASPSSSPSLAPTTTSPSDSPSSTPTLVPTPSPTTSVPSILPSMEETFSLTEPPTIDSTNGPLNDGNFITDRSSTVATFTGLSFALMTAASAILCTVLTY